MYVMSTNVSLSDQMITFLCPPHETSSTREHLLEKVDYEATMPLMERIWQNFLYYTPFLTSNFEIGTYLIERQLLIKMESSLLSQPYNTFTDLLRHRANPFYVNQQNSHKIASHLMQSIVSIRRCPSNDDRALCEPTQGKAHKINDFTQEHMCTAIITDKTLATPLFRALMYGFSSTQLSLENQTHYFAKFIHLHRDDILTKDTSIANLPVYQRPRARIFRQLTTTLNNYRASQSWGIWSTYYQVKEFALTYIPLIRSDWQVSRDHIQTRCSQFKGKEISDIRVCSTTNKANKIMSTLVGLAQCEVNEPPALHASTAPQLLRARFLSDETINELEEAEVTRAQLAMQLLFEPNPAIINKFLLTSPVARLNS